MVMSCDEWFSYLKANNALVMSVMSVMSKYNI